MGSLNRGFLSTFMILICIQNVDSKVTVSYGNLDQLHGIRKGNTVPYENQSINLNYTQSGTQQLAAKESRTQKTRTYLLPNSFPIVRRISVMRLIQWRTPQGRSTLQGLATTKNKNSKPKWDRQQQQTRLHLDHLNHSKKIAFCHNGNEDDIGLFSCLGKTISMVLPSINQHEYIYNMHSTFHVQ